MAASETHSDGDRPREALASVGTPMPTAQFRRRAWLAFQRAIDPLARPGGRSGTYGGVWPAKTEQAKDAGRPHT